MQYTLILQLLPSQAQEAALRETMQVFNAAANRVAEIAFQQGVSSRVAVQRLMYRDVRQRFRLSAQLTVGAIGKACKACRNKALQPVFEEHSAVIYDRRVMSFKGLNQVSLMLLHGRARVPFVLLGYQLPGEHALKEQNYLLLLEETFYVLVSLDLPALVARAPIVPGVSLIDVMSIGLYRE